MRNATGLILLFMVFGGMTLGSARLAHAQDPSATADSRDDRLVAKSLVRLGNGDEVDVSGLPFKPPSPPTPAFRYVGWAQIGLSIATTAAGTTLILIAQNDSQNKNTMETISIACFSVAGVTLITGLVLLLLPEDAPLTQLEVSKEKTVLSFGGRF